MIREKVRMRLALPLESQERAAINKSPPLCWKPGSSRMGKRINDRVNPYP